MVSTNALPNVEGWETHDLRGSPGPDTPHDTALTLAKAKTTRSAPANLPGTTNVPMILSRVFHASEIQSSTIG